MPRKIRSVHKLIVLFVLTSLLPVAALAASGESDVPYETEKLLKRTVQKKVDEIWKDTVGGLHVHRATCAMDFQPAGDERYEVEFYEDKIENDTLTRTRYNLILVPDGKKWKIADQIKLDEISGLERYSPGDDKYFRFDSFSFDKEGLEIKGGSGTLVIHYKGDEILAMSFVPDGLEYNFDPPKDVDFYNRHQIIKKLKKKYLEFTPERARLWCSPELCQQYLDELFVNLRETTKEELHPELLKTLREDERDTRDYRKNANFSGFDFPADPEHVFYGIGVRQKNKKHWLSLMYDAWDPRECAVSVTGLWPVLYRFYSEETRKAGIDPRMLEARPDSEARKFDVKSIEGTVELAIKDSESMSGDLTYELTAHRDLDWVNFRITRNLREIDAKKAEKNPNVKIDFFKDANGKNLFWIQTGPNRGRVLFPTSYKKGDVIKLRMKFSNSGCIYDFSSSYSYVDRGGWLPFVRFGDLIDSLKLTIKVPAKFKAIGIDKKISDEIVDDIRITKWESTHPITFPTVIFGDYFELESETVAKKLDGTKIPVVIHVDKNAMTDSNIRPKQLRPLVEQAAQAINLYTKVYGVEYPFTKLDLVNDPIGSFLYGQAPASIIYLGDGTFRGAGTIASAVGGNAASISRFLKTVVAHETGHQWWGSSTTNANSGNYWFIESLAEYSSALYVEQAEGHQAYLGKVEAWRQKVVENNLMYPTQSGYTEWAGDIRGAAQAAIYNQGPFAFHIMRETFGDKKFFNFLRVLAQSTAGKQIVTRDIQKVAEYAFGGSMDWFFDQWLRGAGLPEYRWDIKSRPTEDGQYLIEGTIFQRVVLGKKHDVLKDTYYRGAIPVKVAFADGTSKKFPILVEGKETHIRFKVTKKPRKIGFNAENEILSPVVAKGEDW